MQIKQLPVIKLVVMFLTAILIAGCASDHQAAPAKSVHHPKPPDDAKTSAVHYPLAAAHTAAENSLAVNGFVIETKKSDDVYLQAQRPRHMGLFVGSGGEVCRIWLKPVGADETEVKVDSNKTFGGALGQKEWDNTVLAEMLRDLNK